MSQFRSEEMNLVQLFVQSDAAHETLHELGQIGAIQFKDLNKDKTAFQRIFVQDVRKCEDMLRIIRYLKGLHKAEKIKTSADDPSNMSSLQELHEKLQELEKEMKEHTDKYTQLQKQRAELEENVAVLAKASRWFGKMNSSGIEFTAPSLAEGRNEMATLLDDGGEGAAGRQRASMLGHIAGCIPTANISDFKTTLFRATRGNMHLQHEELDPRDLSDGAELKSVFIVYFSGERSRQKIDKICDSYSATKYLVEESAALRDKADSDLKERLRDLEIVIRSTSDYRRNKLRSIAGAIDLWDSHVLREKAVFHTLNLFNYDVTNKCLIAEGWCPTMMLPEVREALRRGTLKSGASVQSVINIVKTSEVNPFTLQTDSDVDTYMDWDIESVMLRGCA